MDNNFAHLYQQQQKLMSRVLSNSKKSMSAINNYPTITTHQHTHPTQSTAHTHVCVSCWLPPIVQGKSTHTSRCSPSHLSTNMDDLRWSRWLWKWESVAAGMCFREKHSCSHANASPPNRILRCTKPTVKFCTPADWKTILISALLHFIHFSN